MFAFPVCLARQNSMAIWVICNEKIEFVKMQRLLSASYHCWHCEKIFQVILARLFLVLVGWVVENKTDWYGRTIITICRWFLMFLFRFHGFDFRERSVFVLMMACFEEIFISSLLSLNFKLIVLSIYLDSVYIRWMHQWMSQEVLFSDWSRPMSIFWFGSTGD